MNNWRWRAGISGGHIYLALYRLIIGLQRLEAASNNENLLSAPDVLGGEK